MQHWGTWYLGAERRASVREIRIRGIGPDVGTTSKVGHDSLEFRIALKL